MSNAENPYRSPAVSNEEVVRQAAGGSVSEKTIEYLSAASPWARFLGIMGFIGSGLIALIGLIAMISGPVLASYSGPGMLPFAGYGAILGLIYIGIGVLYIFPSRYSYIIGGTMAKMKTEPNSDTLEKLAKNLKSIILFFGISTIVMIGLSIVGLIVSLVVGVSTAINAYR